MVLQAERNELLQKMLSAVTTVQMRYGGHSGLAVEQDSSVGLMCRSIEDVLLHRVKFRKNIVANIIKDDEDILMWDLITRFMTRSEVSRFESEKSLRSGRARVRSWIRSTLNDGLSEKYLNFLTKADPALLRIYYESDAFMLDTALTAALPDICSGLSSVLFSFDLDKEEFNLPLKKENTPEALMDTTPPTSPQYKAPQILTRQHSKLKKKISRAHIVDVDYIVEHDYKANAEEEKVDVSGLAAKLIPDNNEPQDFDFKSISLLICDKDSSSDDEESFRARLKTDGQAICIESRPPSLKKKHIKEESSVISEEEEEEESPPDRARLQSMVVESPITIGTRVMSQVKRIIGPQALLGTSGPQDILERSYEVGTILDMSIERRPLPMTLEETKEEERSEGEHSKNSQARQECDIEVRIESHDKEDGAGEEEEEEDQTEKDKVAEGGERILSIGSVVDIGDMFEENEQTLCDIVSEEKLNNFDELPRSSSVISKPYSPTVSEIISRKDRFEAMRRYSLEVENSQSQRRSPPLTPSKDVRIPPEGQSYYKDAKEWDDQYLSDTISVCSDASSVRDVITGSFRSTGDGTESMCDSISTSNDSNTYTAGELKQVLMSLLQQKEEMETHNSKLQDALSREIRLSGELRSEVECTRNGFIQRENHDEQVIRGLQRENLMLKQQLRKYVSAIQQLRRDEDFPPDSILAQVLVEVPVVQPLSLPSPTYISPYDNNALEIKLAQVSEMHGELVELNQSLVTTSLARDRRLAELETTLRTIEEREGEKSKRREKKSSRVKKNASISREFTMVDSPLLQVYIPAALLRGNGTDKHHVYQINIRVGEDEWNVYRRYAQFRLLHKQLIEKYPLFNKLEIPGKKHFGSKVAAVVEERRAKLEQYLQTVMSNLAEQGFGIDQDTMDLHSDPTRKALTSAISFFSDDLPEMSRRRVSQFSGL